MTPHLSSKAQQIVDASDRIRSGGRLLDAIAAIDDAVRGPGAENLTTTDRAALLCHLADMRVAQAEWDQAHEHLDDALTLLGGADAKRDYRSLWAAVVERKAFVFLRQQDFSQARALALSIREHASAIELKTVAAAQNTLAGIACHEGRLDDALDHIARAEELYFVAGDASGAASASRYRGRILSTRGARSE